MGDDGPKEALDDEHETETDDEIAHCREAGWPG
jgi:hypothetical protein